MLFLSAFANAAHSNTTESIEPETLKDLIIPASADRARRFEAVELAISSYPESAPVWIAQALVNTPDLQVAELLLQKLEYLSSPSSIKYLAMYHPQNKQLKERTIKLCKNITQTDYPQYALAIVNQDQSKSDLPEFQMTSDICKIWENLNLPRSDAEKWLHSITPQNTITRTMKFCLDRFNCIPSTFIEIVQFRKLENMPKPEILTLKNKFDILADHGYLFSIGDLGLLQNLPIETIKTSRENLESVISPYLQNAKHISRPPAYRNAANDKPDDFAGQKDSLTITDLLRLKLIINYISQNNQKDINSSLTQPTDKSEIGGLIHLKNDSLVFQYYTPGKSIGHHRYIESQQLLSDAPNAIARWHIHDQRNTSRNLAGPGIDDIKYAQNLNSAIVIITLLQDTATGITANFDYVNSSGTTIDITVTNIVNLH